MKLDLVPLARRINEREDVIQAGKQSAITSASAVVAEVLLQGQDMLRVKNSLAHGKWLPWLAKHCPKISERMAQHYMRLASNPNKVAQLEKANSLRQALGLLEDSKDGKTKGEPKQWPPYMEAIGKLSKLVAYVNKFPATHWPEEGLTKFRSELEPVAAMLWPDKFS